MDNSVLTYPEILMARVKGGEIEYFDAVNWLVFHGITYTKAMELLKGVVV
tara:strand:- start:2330 stop:2479 length:150 start_codon:yes stop_codon:yes gene_type:complete